MTSKQFYALDEMEQAETVWKGVQIADGYEDEYHVESFRLLQNWNYWTFI